MSAVVFDTPGLIDVRAFTTMGLSAKPLSSNPIGMFGTGLKYAIAVLVRLGAEPVVWIGRDRHVFQKRPASFRGKEYDLLRMRREKFSLTRASYHDLPFTTEYGRNWQPWMAFRELEANTRDEGGKSYHATSFRIVGEEGRTRIVVDLPAFEAAYDKMDEVFLPAAFREKSAAGTTVQAFPVPSKIIYWRGLRVYELDKVALHTYNFLEHLWLTEDRTLATEYSARSALAAFVARDCEDEDLIEAIVTADDDRWEHELEFDPSIAPSAAFHRVMLRHPKNASQRSWGYYGRYEPRSRTESPWDLYEAHPTPWKVVGDTVRDAKDKPIFDCPYGYVGRWDRVADEILRRMNPKEDGRGEDDADRAEPGRDGDALPPDDGDPGVPADGSDGPR